MLPWAYHAITVQERVQDGKAVAMRMRIRARYRYLLTAALCVGVVLWITRCATFTGNGVPTPVTVDEIVRVSKADVPVDTILAKMRESGTVYRLSASQLAHLHDEGVPDAVGDYMQQTYLEAVRRDQAMEDWAHWTFAADGYWYGGRPYAWPRP